MEHDLKCTTIIICAHRDMASHIICFPLIRFINAFFSGVKISELTRIKLQINLVS